MVKCRAHEPVQVLTQETLERLDVAAKKILKRQGYGYVRTITDEPAPAS